MLSIGNVPNFLAASSPQGLRRLMLLTNSKNGVGHSYFNFYFDDNTKQHICWYYTAKQPTVQEQDQALQEVLKDES